jgi:threonine/homoserine/homoserine lactone efflux protein
MFEIFFLGLALAASPGPDFFLMTNHTLYGGRKLGYITLLGNRCSLIFHLTFALLGLSIILQQSSTVFTFARILGAIYLIYLGYNKLKNGWKLPKNTASPQRVTVTAFQAFKMGFLSNFLNPKVSLFFLSIFPQFLSSEQPTLICCISFLIWKQFLVCKRFVGDWYKENTRGCPKIPVQIRSSFWVSIRYLWWKNYMGGN